MEVTTTLRNVHFDPEDIKEFFENYLFSYESEFLENILLYLNQLEWNEEDIEIYKPLYQFLKNKYND